MAGLKNRFANHVKLNVILNYMIGVPFVKKDLYLIHMSKNHIEYAVKELCLYLNHNK
jgi:hypothetical protein